MLRVAMIGIVLCLGMLPAACDDGGGGGCIVPSPVSTPDWDACHDGWSVDECTAAGGQASSYDCAALGFSTTCPSDGSNTYRRAGYSC